jgi:hypothetical protein
VCPEIAITGAFGVSLAYSTGESYDFAVYRVAQEVFPGEIRLKMRFGIADSQVDALFRIRSSRRAPGSFSCGMSKISLQDQKKASRIL